MPLLRREHETLAVGVALLRSGEALDELAVVTAAVAKHLVAATVVMMTAYAMERRIDEALREGGHAVLRKPFAVEQVMNVIERSLVPRGEMLVLLVDDDAGARITLKNILERKGYSVASAASGKQAIGLVGTADYDVIFLDLRLPDMNGLQAYLKIRELDERVVVFLLTVYRGDSDAIVNEALAKTVRRCLDKPCEPAEVLRALQDIELEARA